MALLLLTIIIIRVKYTYIDIYCCTNNKMNECIIVMTKSNTDILR